MTNLFTKSLSCAFGFMACALFRWPSLDTWLEQLREEAHKYDNLMETEHRVMNHPYE